MRRFGICGRSSFQSDQLQAACCGERFCAGAKKTDGFTRNPRRALTRLNTEKLNTVNRRARSSEIVERLPRSGGSLGRKYEVRRAAMSAMTQSGHDPGQHLLPARPNLLGFEPESSELWGLVACAGEISSKYLLARRPLGHMPPPARSSRRLP